jgi:hypothetical protein
VLAGQLRRSCGRHAGSFRTATRDASPGVGPYVGAQLRLEGKWTLANIRRHVGLSGQNVQHVMSSS